MKIWLKKFANRSALIFVKYPWYRKWEQFDSIWCGLYKWGLDIVMDFYDGNKFLGEQLIRYKDNDLYFRYKKTEGTLQRVSKH